ncbi:MAG: chemotaxis protein CheW [Bdellovibrio sp.]
MNEITRYLCFNLGTDEFAIPLLKVKEVIGIPETTAIPQSPSYFVGIMNLRGSVISILDLRVKLGFKNKNTEETTVIILDLGENSLGVVVDCVNSVMSIASEEISPKPMMDSVKSAEFLTGVFRKQDHLVMLLNIEKTLSVEDKTTLNRATSLPKAA